MTTALAIRDDQEAWNDQQLAALFQMGVSDQISQAELALYFHECRRRRLDPFARQIVCIGRYDKRAGRDVYRAQTTIDGFRVIARRAADEAGIDYSYEDTIWFGPDGGKHEVWLGDGPPAAAKVVVVRNGHRFDATARFTSYVQTYRDGNPQGQWASMPDHMIAKCSEALALRKAFPEDLGGLYTDDEIGQAADGTAAPPAKGMPAGVIARPSADPPAGQQATGETDPDAQAFAGEAWAAHTVAELSAISTRAREARKQPALIRDPESGKTGGLGQYIAHRRRQLEDADRALASLIEAAEAAGVAADSLDERVRGITGTGVEDATPAQLRAAAQALLGAVQP
jgi:phage recombination protein Bet